MTYNTALWKLKNYGHRVKMYQSSDLSGDLDQYMQSPSECCARKVPLPHVMRPNCWVNGVLWHDAHQCALLQFSRHISTFSGCPMTKRTAQNDCSSSKCPRVRSESPPSNITITSSGEDYWDAQHPKDPTVSRIFLLFTSVGTFQNLNSTVVQWM